MPNGFSCDLEIDSSCLRRQLPLWIRMQRNPLIIYSQYLQTWLYPSPNSPASMSPPAGEVSQTPESKTSSGFASVFKSLTGGKPSKSPVPHSPATVPQQSAIAGANVLPTAVYGGPPNYEQLYEQLKAGNPLADRVIAASALRYAVQDYPLSSVNCSRLCRVV